MDSSKTRWLRTSGNKHEPHIGTADNRLDSSGSTLRSADGINRPVNDEGLHYAIRNAIGASGENE